MRVCFLTLGTRGDVQPYLALAKGLVAKGHSAVICTGSSFQDLVEREGVEFRKAALDLMEVANTEVGKAVLEASVKNFRLALKLSREVINPLYRKTMDDFCSASQGADIIVYHPKALVGVDIAIKYDIPCVSMPPVPITIPIDEFPCLAISGRKNYGQLINRLTYKLNGQAESGQIKLINDFRKQTLGFPARNVGKYMYDREGTAIPTVYPVSPYLFRDVKSWEGRVCIPGFFFLNTEERIPDDLKIFLERGGSPITVSFSSMPMKEPEKFVEKLKEALKRSKNRCVLLIGNSGLKCESDSNLFVTRQAPHSVLFSLSKAVMHHGGAGTTAAALLAGKPQIIMPHSVDQPFWAERIRKIGCSIATVSEGKLSCDDLTEYFIRADEPALIEKCRCVSEEIRREKGIDHAVQYLEDQVVKYRVVKTMQ